MSIWAWGENFGFLVEGQKKFDKFHTVWRSPGRQDSVFYSGGNFCNLMGPWGVSAVENVKLKCRAAEYPSTGSLYLIEQRSVIRSESFSHNILPQLIFPLEHQVCASTRLVWWRVRTTPMHSGRNQGFLSNGCIGCIYLVKILAHCAMLQCMSRYNKPPWVALTTTASLTITIKLGAIKYFLSIIQKYL